VAFCDFLFGGSAGFLCVKEDATLDSLAGIGFVFFLRVVESVLFDPGDLFDAAGLHAGGLDGSLPAAHP
jgi:hypothetical protein